MELLVLSACQTAAGDDRAALGLAGVAVRAGARSTLATLWLVDDRAAALVMSQFYRELAAPDTPKKAEAIRRAQVSLMANPDYQHPFYWAPYILVGNWR
ncbi:MAG: CHAT domain-containing protein [Coleofasciculaceae cyanobacterium SM2_3_26]|nr:CHAT domain-containing protein [Coleofasciculaceae cyanobacterium SM2_3_26]